MNQIWIESSCSRLNTWCFTISQRLTNTKSRINYEISKIEKLDTYLLVWKRFWAVHNSYMFILISRVVVLNLLLLFINLFESVDFFLILVFSIDTSYKKAITVVFLIDDLRSWASLFFFWWIWIIVWCQHSFVIHILSVIILHVRLVHDRVLIVLKNLHVVDIYFKFFALVWITVIIEVHIFNFIQFWIVIFII